MTQLHYLSKTFLKAQATNVTTLYFQLCNQREIQKAIGKNRDMLHYREKGHSGKHSNMALKVKKNPAFLTMRAPRSI